MRGRESAGQGTGPLGAARTWLHLPVSEPRCRTPPRARTVALGAEGSGQGPGNEQEREQEQAQEQAQDRVGGPGVGVTVTRLVWKSLSQPPLEAPLMAP